MKATYLLDILIFIFVTLFLYAGVSKLMDYISFKQQLETSPILAPISSITALGIPLLEISISLLLIVPSWQYKGLLCSCMLLSIFTVYIFFLLTINSHIPCNCGGIIESMSWKQHLVFNIFFIALNGLLIRLKGSHINRT